MAQSLGKTLRRYIGREISVSFAAGLAVFSFLLLTARIIELVDLVLARGVPLLSVGRLFLLAVPTFLELTMPAAVLLGVLAAVGRLANDGELTAIRAAGVPWWSLVAPVARVGAVVGLATLTVATFVRPWANRQIVDAVYDVAKSRAAAAIRPGIFNWDFDGIVLFVNRALPESGVLEGILVADERDDRARTRVFAARGTIVADEPERRIRLELSDGTAVTERSGVDSYDLTSFGSFEVNLDVAKDLGGVAGAGERPANMPLDRLLAATRTAAGPGQLEAAIELHRKLAFGAAALLLALTGVPLAVPSSRSVHARGFAVSVGCALAYYVALSGAVMLVRRGDLPPAIGLWIPNAALACFAAYAMSRLGRELPLLPRRTRSARTPPPPRAHRPP